MSPGEHWLVSDAEGEALGCALTEAEAAELLSELRASGELPEGEGQATATDAGGCPVCWGDPCEPIPDVQLLGFGEGGAWRLTGYSLRDGVPVRMCLERDEAEVELTRGPSIPAALHERVEALEERLRTPSVLAFNGRLPVFEDVMLRALELGLMAMERSLEEG